MRTPAGLAAVIAESPAATMMPDIDREKPMRDLPLPTLPIALLTRPPSRRGASMRWRWVSTALALVRRGTRA